MAEKMALSRIRTFFVEVRTEMRKVSWPGKKEVYGTTIVVICAVFFFGIYFGLVDTVLQFGVQGILKLIR